MRALLCLLLLLANIACADDAKDQLFLETLARLPNIDVNANPKLKAKLGGILNRKVGTSDFVAIVAQYKVAGRESDLIKYALTHTDDSAVTASKLVLAHEPALFNDAIANSATAGMTPDFELCSFPSSLHTRHCSTHSGQIASSAAHDPIQGPTTRLVLHSRCKVSFLAT